jgi:NAD(P)-dependent dehydrogenase (short-subunit alcohol dehydrogenase family)
MPSRAVLLTGAAGGLGTVMTAALLADGHAVAAVDRSGEGLARLAASLGAGKERLLPIEAELSDPAACAAAVAAAVAHFGRLEGVVNNAGIGMSSIRPDAETRHPGIAEMTVEVWDRFFAINVRAPLLVTQAALPHLRRAGWGRIVNNTTSYRTMLRVLPYGATKSALESMSAVWAMELDGSGITVNVLVPGGPTDTAFIADMAGWPRHQMLKPAIMGPPIAWLMSEAANGINGKRFTAQHWDPSLPTAETAETAEKAARAIGWPELAAGPAWFTTPP